MVYALISGGGTRIGERISRHLSALGWQVIIHYCRSKEPAQTLARELNALIIQADFSQPEQIDAMIARLPEMPKLVINNAAVFHADSGLDFSVASFEEHMKVNLYAPIHIATRLGQSLQEIDVINILDAWAETLPEKFWSYSLSKKALAFFTSSSASLLPVNIRMNAVALGATLYKDGQIKKVFTTLAQKFPTSIDDILSAIDYILVNKTLRGEVVHIPQWKSVP